MLNYYSSRSLSFLRFRHGITSQRNYKRCINTQIYTKNRYIYSSKRLTSNISNNENSSSFSLLNSLKKSGQYYELLDSLPESTSQIKELIHCPTTLRINNVQTYTMHQDRYSFLYSGWLESPGVIPHWARLRNYLLLNPNLIEYVFIKMPVAFYYDQNRDTLKILKSMNTNNDLLLLERDIITELINLAIMKDEDKKINQDMKNQLGELIKIFARNHIPNALTSEILLRCLTVIPQELRSTEKLILSSLNLATFESIDLCLHQLLEIISHIYKTHVNSVEYINIINTIFKNISNLPRYSSSRKSISETHSKFFNGDNSNDTSIFIALYNSINKPLSIFECRILGTLNLESLTNWLLFSPIHRKSIIDQALKESIYLNQSLPYSEVDETLTKPVFDRLKENRSSKKLETHTPSSIIFQEYLVSLNYRKPLKPINSKDFEISEKYIKFDLQISKALLAVIQSGELSDDLINLLFYIHDDVAWDVSEILNSKKNISEKIKDNLKMQVLDKISQEFEEITAD